MKNPFKYKFPVISTLTIIIMTSIFPACKKNQEDPSPPYKPVLMIINFTHDFINPKLKAVVFISDAAGNSLVDTMVSGNPRLELYAKTASTPPYQVTIVKWEPDMHNFLVTMQTYLNVMPAEWTIQGNRLISLGDASFSLRNVPSHQGPILTSNSGHANLTFATSGAHPVYKSPDDLYVKIKTPEGPKYKWAAGLVPGGNLETDLSTMGAAIEQTITFPGLFQDFNARVFGYRDTNYTTALAVMTDEVLGEGVAKDNISVSYPPSVFIGFHTYLEIIESWTSESTYTYSKDGPIPTTFLKTDAAITNIHPDGNKVSFVTTGSFTITAAKWSFVDAANLAFEWTVSGPDSLTSITLPELPKAMTTMFPTLAPDSLKLRQFELTGYPGASTYPAYLKALFDPEHPGRGGHLEASGVRVVVE